MAEITLYSRRAPTQLVALVDDAHVDLVSAYRWSVFSPRGSKTRYARTSAGGKTLYLHRLIMAAETDDEIDHVNGDGLDNRRSNLRFVTHTENLRSAARLPGRYGNLTIEELDRELEEFESQQNAAGTELVKVL